MPDRRAARCRGVLAAAAILGGVSSARAAGDGQDSDRPRLVAQVGSNTAQFAVSSDGAFVATGDYADASACLWRADTGEELRHFALGIQGFLESLAFTPDGALLVTGDSNGFATWWSLATGKQVRRQKVTGDLATSNMDPFEGCKGIRFSADGRRLLTWGGAFARCWSADGATLIRSFEHGSDVADAIFSPDGATIWTAGAESFGDPNSWTIRAWDATTGTERRRVPVGAAVLHVDLPSDAMAFVVEDEPYTFGIPDKGRASFLDLASGEAMSRLACDPAGLRKASISPDGRRTLTCDRDGVARLWDSRSGRELLRFDATFSAGRMPGFFVDGGPMLVSRDGALHRFAVDSGREVARYEGLAVWPEEIRLDADGKSLLSGGSDGSAHLWDLASGGIVRRFPTASGRVGQVAISNDSRFAFTGDDRGAVTQWELATGSMVAVFQAQRRPITCVAVSGDASRMLSIAMDESAIVWDVESREPLLQRTPDQLLRRGAITSDGKRVYLGDGGSADGGTLWSLDGEIESRKLELPAHSMIFDSTFSADGRSLAVGIEEGCVVLDIESGREIERRKLPGGGSFALAFSRDGRWLARGSDDGTVRWWEVGADRPVRMARGRPGKVTSLQFAADVSRIFSEHWDRSLRVWSVDTGEELAALFAFRDGGWAVTDPAGRFDASNAGDVEGLHWVIGTDVISLSQLKDRYYEPGLLAKVLGLNKEPLRQVDSFQAPRLYPSIRLEQVGPKLRIHLADRGGGIGPVSVMVNGKERTADARGTEPVAKDGSLLLEVDLTGDPRLLTGQSNRIEAFAYNEEGYLRSRGAGSVYVAPGVKQIPSLWAIVAGVSDYRGTALDLKYAAKDAEDFATALSLAANGLFGSDRTHVLRLDNPKRDALLGGLQEARSAKAGDVFVMYLAGHGVSRGDGFYFLTSEAETADLTDPNQQRTTAVSSTELVDAIKEIPALKQVLILDTCASGRFIEALTAARSAPSSQVRALDRLKDRTGMFVLAGCASDTVSYEASKFGQGLLTYSLLLGMKGGQLRENEFVDVSTLFNFAADKVPEFAADVGGIQRPLVASPRGGESFDIGRLTEKDKAAVPLHAVRPLFCRPIFLDVGEGADVLGLGERLVASFRNESGGGSRSLVFVDTPSFPGAFQISGSYTTRDDAATVRFKIRRGKEAVSDWIEVDAPNRELESRILAEALKRLPADWR